MDGENLLPGVFLHLPPRAKEQVLAELVLARAVTCSARASARAAGSRSRSGKSQPSQLSPPCASLRAINRPKSSSQLFSAATNA